MKSQCLRPFLLFVVMWVFVALVGCASPSKPAQFYLLSAEPVSMQELEIAKHGRLDEMLRIGVGPILLPNHLARPQIVTRSGGSEIYLDEFHRWAGALDKDFARVLADALSRSLVTDAVLTYPWTETLPLNYQIEVEVARLDGKLGGQVSLQARWIIFGDDNGSPLRVKSSNLSATADDNSYASYVAAQARLVHQLAKEIASAVAEIEQGS